MCIQFSKSVRGYTSAWGNNPLTYLELEVQMTPYFQKKFQKNFLTLKIVPITQKRPPTVQCGKRSYSYLYSIFTFFFLAFTNLQRTSSTVLQADKRLDNSAVLRFIKIKMVCNISHSDNLLFWFCFLRHSKNLFRINSASFVSSEVMKICMLRNAFFILPANSVSSLPTL